MSIPHAVFHVVSIMFLCYGSSMGRNKSDSQKIDLIESWFDFFSSKVVAGVIASMSVFFVTIIVAFLIRFLIRLLKEKYQEARGTLSSINSGSRLQGFGNINIGNEIKIVGIIGMGSYGDVSLAEWRGDEIAVKAFNSAKEASWSHETAIYETPMISHRNILQFIAADMKIILDETKKVIITEYHENGSLYNYLKINNLDVSSLLKLACSAATGLAHLHTAIFARKTKPAIAHRDLKSHNILVKKDGSCAIADFGLAVCDNDTNKKNMASNKRVGTVRYMSPEVLANTLNETKFDFFKMADVYSLSLILWEISRRCVSKHGQIEEYQLPYFDCVSSNPSIDEMSNAICKRKMRPVISDWWPADEYLQTMLQIMSKCWLTNPDERLTALEVKKMLQQLKMKLHEGC